VLDEWSRESLAIEIDVSLTGPRVLLEYWSGSARSGGIPVMIQAGNGPELRRRVLDQMGLRTRSKTAIHHAWKPNQNAFIERFNRSYRTEVLNGWLFASPSKRFAKSPISGSSATTRERSHHALGNLPPAAYRERLLTGLSSTLQLST
jgi:putative transposase